MMWQLVIALQCGLLLVSAVEEAPTEVPTGDSDEFLVRCKRPLCEMFCPFGNHLDENGCEICQCLEDPCKDFECGEMQMCQAKKCEGYPCHEIEPECTAAPVCSLVMCRMYCPFGFARDENGCERCECKDPCEGIDCEPGTQCQPNMAECQEEPCDMQPLCVPVGAPEKPQNKSTECPMLKCAVCTYGYKTDSAGCNTCQCRTHPCEDHVCQDDEICQPHKVMCFAEPCPMMPSCVAKPLCHHMRDTHMHKIDDGGLMDPADSMGHMSSRMARSLAQAVRRARQAEEAPQCEEDGDFKPIQCHRGLGECWCVDDRGQEIPDTRASVKNKEPTPSCVKNRTTSVDVSLKMKHDLDNVDEHMDAVKEVTHEHLSQLLLVEEVYITELQISPSEEVNILEVDFTIIRDEDGALDLPSCMNHFTNHWTEITIDYKGYTLEMDPDSLTTQHHFETEPQMTGPELPAEGGVKDERSDAAWKFCQNHKVAMTVALMGALLMFAILGVVCCAVVKKKKANLKAQRMQKFKENLAFSNELYGQVEFGEPGQKSKLELLLDDEPPIEKKDEVVA